LSLQGKGIIKTIVQRMATFVQQFLNASPFLFKTADTANHP